MVFAGQRVPDHGYGEHVVVAHRLPEGGLVYTVYAPISPKARWRERRGHGPRSGDRLGQVGDTGVASSPHLHFEVRLARDPQERWEKTKVVDPLAFVGAHQASAAADSTLLNR